jgi:hypothetical protein
MWAEGTDSRTMKVGLYSWDTENSRPKDLLAESTINITASSNWFKTAPLNISINPNTIYAIVVLNSYSNLTLMNTNYTALAGETRIVISGSNLESLPDPMGAVSSSSNTYRAFYAVYETGSSGRSNIDCPYVL